VHYEYIQANAVTGVGEPTVSISVSLYSETCLKRNLKGSEHFSAEARFPFHQGIL
jgi:hypothetical protein